MYVNHSKKEKNEKSIYIYYTLSFEEYRKNTFLINKEY